MIGETLPLDLVIGRADKAAVWIPALTVNQATTIPVRFSCDHCGHVALFDAAKLGFTP